MSKKQQTLDEVKKLGLENLAELLESSLEETESDEHSEEETKTEETVSEDEKSPETFDKLFEGVELPEGFLEKAKVIFAAAVQEKVDQVSGENLKTLEEKIQATLDKQLKEDADQLDAYLTYVTEEWYKENAPIVESKFKVELASEIVESVKGVLAKYNVEITPEQDVVVESLKTELAEANARIDDLVLQLKESKDASDKVYCESVIDKAVADMTDVEADRFKKVLGEMDFQGREDFSKKVDVLKSVFIKEGKSTTSVEEGELTESKKEIEVPIITEETDADKPKDPKMASYLSAIRKTSRK